MIVFVISPLLELLNVRAHHCVS